MAAVGDIAYVGEESNGAQPQQLARRNAAPAGGWLPTVPKILRDTWLRQNDRLASNAAPH